jgi:hypothetical protein
MGYQFEGAGAEGPKARPVETKSGRAYVRMITALELPLALERLKAVIEFEAGARTAESIEGLHAELLATFLTDQGGEARYEAGDLGDVAALTTVDIIEAGVLFNGLGGDSEDERKN